MGRPRKGRKLTADELTRLSREAAAKYGVPPETIMSSSVRPRVVLARYEFIRAAAKLSGLSMRSLGAQLGFSAPVINAAYREAKEFKL